MANNDLVNNSFLGTGWSFPPTFNKDVRGVMMVKGEADIQESLNLLLSTLPAERPVNTEYGCPVNQFLFDGIDTSTLNKLEDVVEKAILYFEPRVQLTGVTIDPTRYLDGMLFISLDYIVRTTNSRNNMVFPYYLNEGTLLDM